MKTTRVSACAQTKAIAVKSLTQSAAATLSRTKQNAIYTPKPAVQERPYLKWQMGHANKESLSNLLFYCSGNYFEQGVFVLHRSRQETARHTSTSGTTTQISEIARGSPLAGVSKASMFLRQSTNATKRANVVSSVELTFHQSNCYCLVLRRTILQ